MKINVAEATPSVLNSLVAKCEGTETMRCYVISKLGDEVGMLPSNR